MAYIQRRQFLKAYYQGDDSSWHVTLKLRNCKYIK